VTAEGDVLLCDKNQNVDLLWAARGAGPGLLPSALLNVRGWLIFSRLSSDRHVISPRGSKQLLSYACQHFYVAFI
jgi:hypothetical protein